MSEPVTLQQAETTLRVWEAAALNLERGRGYEVNRRAYRPESAADREFVAGEVIAWRRTVTRLAAAARAAYAEIWGARGGFGRRVIGTMRRVR